MPNNLVLDSNFLCYRAKTAMANMALSYNDIDTTIIYSFLKQVLSLSKRFDTKQIIFCWDSKKSIRRMKYFSGYKIKRIEKRKIKTKEEKALDYTAYQQFTELRKYVLPELGFKNIFLQSGYESDDIIATVINDNKEDHNIIVARDNDLLQLLNANTVIYDPISKVITTSKKFTKKYGVLPETWAQVKTISGCKTDEIPGVEKVGDITAIKYITKELKNTTKTFKNIASFDEALLKRNEVLVTLPFPNTNTFQIKKDNLTTKKLSTTFHRYGLRSFLDEPLWSRWVSLCKS